MAARNYSFSNSEYLDSDADTYWNADTSQFVWDSPQPDNSYLDAVPEDILKSTENVSSSERTPTEISATPTAGKSQATTDKHPLSKSRVPHGTTSAPSTTSEESSQSSSSGQPARRARQSSTSTPPEAQGAQFIMGEDTPPAGFKMENGFGDEDDTYQLEDSAYPLVGVGMDNLSLNSGVAMTGPDFKFSASMASPDPLSSGLYTDRNDTYSPRQFTALRNFQHNTASPQLTVQPSKMFYIGNSRETSPMIQTNEDSPVAFFNGNSPLSTTSDVFGNSATGTPNLSGLGYDLSNSSGMQSTRNANAQAKASTSGSHWPCRLTVEPIPDKSRVETQIPIKLTLYNVPSGIQRIHLPPHTISKPKFQAKPPFHPSADTLELSTMLVCASAMQKDGLEEIAFQRAAADEVFGLIEDPKSGTSVVVDENDPLKPLNGGPVAICQGCIVRERKRAARKKTKKAEEEEEWARDEAKRVIVFNCAEVRDWCVPGTKETAVRDHDTPVETMFVNAPMRIACYCRHQSEKVGFQVIFTIRTTDGTILAQAMSDSIMITDDHKQPSASASLGLQFAGQIPGAGMFPHGQGFGVYPTFAQEIPFRSSWSTNDLRTLGNQYAPQRRPANFQRQNSTGYSSQVTTATATPRNLSRPASPTSPSGHSTKKRRSGGASHGKLPSGLTMTRIEDLNPNTAATLAAGGPLSAGATPSTFNFASSTSSNPFSTSLEQQFGQTPVTTPNPYQSEPPTPLTGALQNSGYASASEDRYAFYSAPTSQHASRAPSPTNTRGGSFSGMGIPQQAAYALASLPPGLNLQRPPIIQRLIPNVGPKTGGEEVTVLGSGFFQGLEVMFGDRVATNTIFWGDTTLVCRTPASDRPGMVPVVFGHQHHTAPQELQQLQGLLPTRLVPYHYTDDADRNQMSNMAAAMAGQGQGFNLNQLSQDDLQRAFVSSQANYGNFARARRPPG